MTDKALLEKALRALEVFYKLSPAPTLLELMEEISKRIDALSKKEKAKPKRPNLLGPNNPVWRSELTVRYEQAKALKAAGLKVSEACRQSELTQEQWYRRVRMETTGRDRVKK